MRWLLTAAVAAYACHLAVHHATPIDRALPFIAVIVTLVAAVSYPSLMVGVVLLVVAEIGVIDEGTRLLAFGAILAAIWSAGVPRRLMPAASRAAGIGVVEWRRGTPPRQPARDA
ncbi:MAG: hypothetical protein ACJ74H_05615, partial [Thermoanaerobaculia bacterium]